MAKGRGSSSGGAGGGAVGGGSPAGGGGAAASAGGGVSGQALTTAPLSEFAGFAQQAADASEDRTFSDRAYISDAWQSLRDRGSDITLEQFKQRLLQANQGQLLTLGRNDIAYAAPNQSAVKASATTLPGTGNEVHFIYTSSYFTRYQ